VRNIKLLRSTPKASLPMPMQPGSLAWLFCMPKGDKLNTLTTKTRAHQGAIRGPKLCSCAAWKDQFPQDYVNHVPPLAEIKRGWRDQHLFLLPAIPRKAGRPKTKRQSAYELSQGTSTKRKCSSCGQVRNYFRNCQLQA